MSLTTQKIQRILERKGHRSVRHWALEHGFEPNQVLTALRDWERGFEQRVYSVPYGNRYQMLTALDKDLRTEPDKPVLQFLINEQLAA